MPIFRVAIGADGPVIDLGVKIGRAMVHTMVAQGQAPPQPLTVRALIDTGSDVSAVEPNVLVQIGSVATGMAQIRRPGTGTTFLPAAVHDIRLSFGGAQPGALWIPISIVEAVPSTPSVLAIIGRDTLAHCQFVYDGFRGELLLVS
jgi:hypothetical protein